MFDAHVVEWQRRQQQQRKPTIAGFDEWVEQHADTFGLSVERYAATFERWEEVFALSDYTIDDLKAATLSLAGHNPPRYFTDHLPAIHAAIRDRRKALTLRPDDGPREWHCNDCGGSGVVEVPHIRFFVKGVWQPPYYRMAVACHCARGAKVQGTYPEARRLVALSVYAERVPHWQELLERRSKALIANAKARESAWLAGGMTRSQERGARVSAALDIGRREAVGQVVERAKR